MEEFYAQWTDGEERIFLAEDFDDARRIARSIGALVSMDYADCLWPEYYQSMIAKGNFGLRSLSYSE